MIKKIIAVIIFHVVALSGAAHQIDIASYTTEEKQNLLLSYMFSKGFIAEIVPCIRPYNIVCRIELLQKLRGLYQPGQLRYVLAKNSCRDICRLIQATSLQHKDEIVRSYVRFNLEPVIKNRPYAVQYGLEGTAHIKERTRSAFADGIKTLFDALWLQQALQIPLIEDREFDILYQQKMEQSFEHLSRAITFQASFEVEEPQIIKDLLSKQGSDAAELDTFVAVAFDQTREILDMYVKQDDPYCGF